MNKLFVATFLFSSLGLIAAEKPDFYKISVPQNAIYNILKTRGFCEIGNKRFLKGDYNKLYQSFDNFIKLMSKNKDFAMRIHSLEKEFLSIGDNKKRYCSAPPSYRDPREFSTKRFNKIYFQFIKEHYELLTNKYPDLLEGKLNDAEFLSNMATLDNMSKELFAKIIDSLEVSRPGIKKMLHGEYDELTVISKIVRYEKTSGWGTTPHRDKSVITLIWGSDDDNDDSLLLCEDMQKPSIAKLQKPQRLFSQKDDVTSTILIPGAACAKGDIDLEPTVHGVAPIKKEYRHAVISFLLLPDTDMSDIMSDFIESAN